MFLIKLKIYSEKYSEIILGIQMHLEYNWKISLEFLNIMKIFIYPVRENLGLHRILDNNIFRI